MWPKVLVCGCLHKQQDNFERSRQRWDLCSWLRLRFGPKLHPFSVSLRTWVGRKAAYPCSCSEACLLGVLTVLCWWQVQIYHERGEYYRTNIFSPLDALLMREHGRRAVSVRWPTSTRPWEEQFGRICIVQEIFTPKLLMFWPVWKPWQKFLKQ